MRDTLRTRPGRALAVTAAGVILPLLLGRCTPAEQEELTKLAGDLADGGTLSASFEMHFERFDQGTRSLEALTPPPTERVGTTLLAAAGKLLVMGGLDPRGNYASAVELYDPATKTWTRGAAWPKPRSAWLRSVGDRLVCAIGGFNGANLLRGTPQVECYDVAADSWSIRAPIPDDRDGVWPAVVGDKVYLLGGVHNTTEDLFRPLDSAAVYDSKTDTWTSLAKLPAPRGGSAVHALGGKLYVVGGYSTDWTSSAKDEERQMLVYDPVGDSWSLAPQMPSPRWLFGSATLRGELAVFLGIAAGPLLERYAPATSAWSAAPEPQLKLDPGVYTSIVHDDALYLLVLADKVSATQVSASGKLWRFDMTTNTWSIVGERSPDSRDADFMGASLDHELYFVGAFTKLTVTPSSPTRPDDSDAGSGDGG